MITGSNAYGLATENSDYDITGWYIVPPKLYAVPLPIEPPLKSNKDTSYHSIKQVIDMLSQAKPNVLELLWIPQDCLLYQNNAIMSIFQKYKNYFITKKAYHSHAQYARSQIHKAKGQNKKVNNPESEQPPSKLDFCSILLQSDMFPDDQFPCRPRELTKYDEELISRCRMSKMEKSRDAYRLYDYSDAKKKGAFRGQDEILVLDSIPKEDENKRFVGLLFYNVDAYKKRHKQWREYWQWVRDRNPYRWGDQENGVLDYDAKNLSHCLRLNYSAINILKNGQPKVRFEGEERKILMSVKNGEWSYEQIMSLSEEQQEHMKELWEASDLPEKISDDIIYQMTYELMDVCENW